MSNYLDNPTKKAFITRIVQHVKQVLCNHRYDCDTELKLIRCKKCKHTTFIVDFKSLYSIIDKD